MQKSMHSRFYLPFAGAALSVSLLVQGPRLPGWTLGAAGLVAAPVPMLQTAAALWAAPEPSPVPAPTAALPAPALSVPPQAAGPAAAGQPPAVEAALPAGPALSLPEGEPPAGAGAVKTKTFRQAAGGVFVACGPATIRNNTKTTGQDRIQAAVAAGLPFAVTPHSPDPQVLILHTHATECYLTHTGPWYAPGDTGRSTDTDIGVCAVGQVMTDVLNGAGISTLHDTTLHDYPSYNAAYDNSRKTAQTYLAKYPSIRVVIDVHRDAIESDGVRIAPAAEIGGRRAAQVMLISGADNGGSVKLPHCMENLAFAAAWQTAMESAYPGLTRPVLYSHRFYNQDLSTGALLLEVGSHGTSLDQALYAGELAARALAAALTGQL